MQKLCAALLFCFSLVFADGPPVPPVRDQAAYVGPSNVIRWDGWRPGMLWQITLADGQGRKSLPLVVPTNSVFAGMVFHKMTNGTYSVRVQAARKDGSVSGEPVTMRIAWVGEDQKPVSNLRAE